MMRVLMAMAGAHHGGAEAFFERLAAGFVRRGVDLKVAIRRDLERAARLSAAEVSPLELPFGGPLDFRTRAQLRREVSAFAPHVFLSFMSRAARFAPRGVAGVRLNIARLGGYYAGKYYRRSDHLIGNTADICRHLVAEGFPAERVHYLPNFVDEAPCDPAPGDTAPVILAMGRLHGNKAFDVLLDALATVPDARLWLAGDGDLADDLNGQATELGLADRVRFLGWVEDPRPLIEAADIVAVPSRHEPLGNVVLEAWARRKPVVAAASDGPSVLIDDGVNGLLTPVDDYAALARALKALLDDASLRDRIAGAGQKTYQANFSEATVVGAYLSLFERLCADNGIDWKNS